MYKVTFYTLSDGNSPISDFLDSSQKSLRSKIIRQFGYLEEFGLTSINPNLRKLTGTPLWEVRILGKDSVRIICVALVSKEIVIVHIFTKRKNKTPSIEIRTALKRYWLLDR